MKKTLLGMASAFALAATTTACAYSAPEKTVRTTMTTDAAAAASPIVTAGSLAFPSGAAGTKGTAMEQVDEIVATMEQRLQAAGLGMGDMMQHTIFLKDGAAPPIEILNRFHAAARKLAPTLIDKPSVGTIVRVPSLPDPNALVAVDLVASSKHGADLSRKPFIFGPKEIGESIGSHDLLFSAGLEAMDFEHGTLKPTIEEQVDVIVAKLNGTMQRAGLGLENMVSHNLYVTKGTDPLQVIDLFHKALRKYTPTLRDYPSSGTLLIVDGMAVDGFLLEIDAIASRTKPQDLSRVPFTEMQLDIVKSVAAQEFVFVSGLEGTDFTNGGKVSPDIAGQARIAAAKIADTLQRSNLRPSDVVKYRINVRKGSDAAVGRKAFYDALAEIDPAVRSKAPAETMIIVEGFALPNLEIQVTAIAARSR